MSMGNTRRTKIVVLAVLMMAGGCSDENARVAQVAVDAAHHQAEQNREMSQLNREVAAGTKRLVESQADADRHRQAMQKDIHDQQNELEAERRQQADTRQRDSMLAPVLMTLGVLLVCSLPLIVCWKLLTGLGNEPEEATLAQLLIDDVIDPNGIASSISERLPALSGPQAPVAGIESQPPRPVSDRR